MFRNRRLTVAGFVTAALGLGGTLVAYCAKQEKSPQTVVAADSSWDGSARTAYSNTVISYNGGSYYVIRTAAELAYVATNAASWTKNFLVVEDLDLGNKNWTPIAPVLNSETLNAFEGILDFNGHIVKNLSITGTYKPTKKKAWTVVNLGLVSNNNGTIRNLNLADVTIDITCGNYRNYIGAIAGYNGGLIESVTLSNLSQAVAFTPVAVMTNTANYENAAGAMVGFNGGTIKNALYLSGEASVTSTVRNTWWNSNEINAGTIYGSGDSDCTTTNVYTDTNNTTTTIASSVTNNTTTSEGDLADLTTNQAVDVINEDINGSSGGDAALPVDETTILIGGSSSPSTGSGSSGSSSGGTPTNEATDLLVNFLLLNTCQDYNQVGDYWTAYWSDATTKSRFDAYVITDSGSGATYTAGNRLLYMHNYALAMSSGSGQNGNELSGESSEGSALLLVGGVTIALASFGYVLIKKKIIA